MSNQPRGSQEEELFIDDTLERETIEEDEEEDFV